MLAGLPTRQLFVALATSFFVAAPPAAWAAPDNTRGMALMGANVNGTAAGATLISGSGVTGVSRSGVGQYVVTFDRDIEDCAYATAPITNIAAIIAGFSGNQITINLRLINGSMTLVDTRFSLIVFCPK